MNEKWLLEDTSFNEKEENELILPGNPENPIISNGPDVSNSSNMKVIHSTSHSPPKTDLEGKKIPNTYPKNSDLANPQPLPIDPPNPNATETFSPHTRQEISNLPHGNPLEHQTAKNVHTVRRRLQSLWKIGLQF